MSRRRPSPLGAAIASAALPGWGQVRVGQGRLGWALATASIALFLGAATAVLSEGPLGALAWLVDPDFLLVLVVANLGLALVRAWATFHAWRAAGGRLPSLILITVLLAVIGPHAALAYYGLETRSTLVRVFPGPVPPPTATTRAEVTIARLTTSTLYRPLVPPNPIPTSSPTTAPATPPLGERLTVLLLGGDAGPGRPGLRTDTVIVATVDTETGDAALFGLPRSMGGFTFSDGTPFPGLSRGLLNEVYQWGWRYPGRFPGEDPGAEAMVDVASTLLGIPIDHYILVDMVGFAEIVDALGGVQLTIPQHMEAPLYDRAGGGYTMITFQPGPQRLDGDHALAYARSRTGSDDYARMGRQRCLLSALASQVEPLHLFGRLPALLDVVERRLATDLPLSEIPFLIDLAPRLDLERVVVVGFERGYRAGRTATGLWVPDRTRIQATVQQVLSGQSTEGGLPTAESSCR